MSVFYMENFEWASGEVPLSKRYLLSNGTGISLSNSAGMYGTCIKLDPASNALTTAFRYSHSAISSFLLSFAMKRESVVAATGFHVFGSFDQGNSSQVFFGETTSGTIRFINAGSSNIIGETSPITFSTNRERYEVGMYLSSTTGTLSFKHKNNLLINITGIKTNNDSSTMSSFRLGAFNGSNIYYDDIYMDDDKNAFKGDVRIHSLYPTGYTQQQSSPSTGLYSWATIDESPIATGDYAVFSGGQYDIYSMAGITGNPYIYSVGILSYVSKPTVDVASGRHVLSIGASSISGSLMDMPIASGFVSSYFSTDPSGNSWTKSAVNTTLLSFGKEIL